MPGLPAMHRPSAARGRIGLAARVAAAGALATIGCGKSRSQPAQVVADPWSIDAAAGAAGAAAERCQRLPFAAQIDLAEASGADWVPAEGARPAHILVVGDSGNRGAYAAVDATSGAVLARGRLPLDGRASDDLEGLAAVGDDVYAITSSGWMRRWRRVADDWGFELADPAYPLAPRGDAAGLTCDVVNCGKNFEGLCLRKDAVESGACAGFAAAKADGRLYCLVRADDVAGRLRLDPARTIAVSPPETLTSCDFAPDSGLLWAGTNAFDGAMVYQIHGWRDPGTAVVEAVDRLGSGFPESMAVSPDGIVFRFSDTGGAPSSQDRYRCK